MPLSVDSSTPLTWSPDSNLVIRFFRGRTNAVKLYHVVREGEKVHYLDFTSLYPGTNKNCYYPVRHP